MMMDLCRTVEAAREILPPEVAIQVPPNLVDPRPLLAAGANDLGGISAVTVDGINPERPWPDEESCIKAYLIITWREAARLSPLYCSWAGMAAKPSRLVPSLAGEDGLRAKKYIF